MDRVKFLPHNSNQPIEKCYARHRKGTFQIVVGFCCNKCHQVINASCNTSGIATRPKNGKNIEFRLFILFDFKSA